MQRAIRMMKLEEKIIMPLIILVFRRSKLTFLDFTRSCIIQAFVKSKLLPEWSFTHCVASVSNE